MCLPPPGEALTARVPATGLAVRGRDQAGKKGTSDLFPGVRVSKDPRDRLSLRAEIAEFANRTHELERVEALLVDTVVRACSTRRKAAAIVRETNHSFGCL